MSSDEPDQVIALVAEQLTIAKAQVITDQVRVATIVEERPVTVESTIERSVLDVVRIPVERAVLAVPEPRQDGDTLIVSIVEERLVVEKRLFVVEELHITTTRSTEHISVADTVRTMRATIARPGASSDEYATPAS